MNLHAFNAGCNIIGIIKNNRNYGMCCAWAQMLDYDRIGMLLGAQSVTGRVLNPGDKVGVSGLAAGQEAIARQIGDGHSDQMDKYASIGHDCVGSAILIKEARTRMVCEVVEVRRFACVEADRYVIMKVLSFEQDESIPFLSAYFE
ncbi:MAG: flavin reductase [bacterium]